MLTSPVENWLAFWNTEVDIERHQVEKTGREDVEWEKEGEQGRQGRSKRERRKHLQPSQQ
jgi:hypothetical protein